MDICEGLASFYHWPYAGSQLPLYWSSSGLALGPSVPLPTTCSFMASLEMPPGPQCHPHPPPLTAPGSWGHRCPIVREAPCSLLFQGILQQSGHRRGDDKPPPREDVDQPGARATGRRRPECRAQLAPRSLCSLGAGSLCSSFSFVNFQVGYPSCQLYHGVIQPNKVQQI